MCLVVVAWNAHPDYTVILAGNRDEFHARPAAQVGWWSDPEGILGGRDLEAGGGWLAVDRRGRLAVVTNFRESPRTAGIRSRGELVVEVLSHPGPVRDWVSTLDGRRDEYGGFNLLVRDGVELHCLGNRGGDRFDLPPGIYGLSNHLLDTPWPKVTSVKDGIARMIRDGSVATEGLFDLLADRTQVREDKLPNTGVPLEWERALSSVFVAGADYGTRASTVVLIRNDGSIELEERRFGPGGVPTGRSRFELSP